jgi:hypothetical protein
LNGRTRETDSKSQAKNAEVFHPVSLPLVAPREMCDRRPI